MKRNSIKLYDFIACETHTDISTRFGTDFGVPIGFADRRRTIWEASPVYIDVQIDVDMKAGDVFTLLAFDDAKAFCDHESVSPNAYRKYFGL